MEKERIREETKMSEQWEKDKALNRNLEEERKVLERNQNE